MKFRFFFFFILSLILRTPELLAQEATASEKKIITIAQYCDFLNETFAALQDSLLQPKLQIEAATNNPNDFYDEKMGAFSWSLQPVD